MNGKLWKQLKIVDKRFNERLGFNQLTRLESHFNLQKTLAFGRMMTTENQR